jgi:hypothetical protein
VPRGKGRNWLRDLHDGWTEFWTRTWFRDVVVGFSAYNLIYATYTVLGPVMSRRYYGGAAAWAAIVTAAAIGSVLAGALGGGGLLVFESLWQTSVQRHVPEQMLSRAGSCDWFGSLVAYPVGLAIAGPLAAAAGPRPVLLAIGVLLVVVMTLLLAVPSVRQLTDDTPTPVTGGADAPAAL